MEAKTGAEPELRQPSGDVDRQATEADLIRRICVGEKELYYELIRPYQHSVYLVALSVVRDEADAEDVAQDAFLKALRALPTFRGEARFSTWIERIALNEGRQRLRRARLEKLESLDGHFENEDEDYLPRDFGDWREIPSEVLERKEVQEILARAIARLPRPYREVLVLRDVRQLNIADTADALGLTAASVKSRLWRARLQLRDLIAPFQSSSSVLSRSLFRKGRKPW